MRKATKRGGGKGKKEGIKADDAQDDSVREEEIEDADEEARSAWDIGFKSSLTADCEYKVIKYLVDKAEARESNAPIQIGKKCRGRKKQGRAEGNPNRLCREQGRDSIKQKSCHKKLATSSKILSIGLGSFSQRVNAMDDFGCEKNGGCNCENE
ncbi:hypothetical protein PIB30_025537 [Stylosanthes scabra]|uniref:Uncharacterized protein n=1 Tax=Stylosanthes scabra TaxID=79078 RepID=A0ABU6Z6V2_9FABA|nr:hypothetical protein [Stylosanthes scabra]